jgi:antitoxin YefM
MVHHPLPKKLYRAYTATAIPTGKPAVIMSLEDFKSYEETAYLMSSPKNARRLNQSIAKIEAGKSKPHGIIEE